MVFLVNDFNDYEEGQRAINFMVEAVQTLFPTTRTVSGINLIPTLEARDNMDTTTFLVGPIQDRVADVAGQIASDPRFEGVLFQKAQCLLDGILLKNLSGPDS